MKRPAGITLSSGVLVAVLAVIAYAFWATSGDGNATSATGTTLAMTLTPPAVTAHLYPGGTANVVLTVSNPNLFTVKVVAFTRDTAQGTSGYSVDGGHSGCSVAALTYTTQTNAGAGWTIPAKANGVNGSELITLTNALAMSSSAGNACQGAIFAVFLKAD